MATNNDKRTTDERKWPALLWIESAKRWQVDGRLGTNGKDGGRRETFLTRVEADARRQELREQQRRSGTEAVEVSTELRVEAVTCARRLAEKGATLTQATDHYLEYLATSFRSILWPAFLKEYLDSFYVQGVKEKELEVRESHFADVRQRLGHFAEWAKNRLVSEITKNEITDWLNAQIVTKPRHPRLGENLTAVSERKVRSLLSSAYNFAIDCGYAKINPASIKRRVRRKKKLRTGLGTASKPAASHLKMNEILWPEEYSALLHAASDRVLPALVFQGLCGIRRSEVGRCIWDQVDWKEGIIHFPSHISKTGEYRFIPIRPAVAAWLDKYKDRMAPDGLIAPKNYREELDRARAKARAALVKAKSEHALSRWPVNCQRHGFASFYLAAELGTMDKLADEMGTSVSLIKSTYRQVTKLEIGKAYWAITP